MNRSLTLRYFIELCMILPAAAISILPVYYSRKVRKSLLFGLLGIMLTAVIAGGSVICAMFGISSNTVAFLSMIVFFLAYHFCFDLSLPKKIFCFANATMLCGFATTYTTFLTAPAEIVNSDDVYKVSSGVICLVTALLVCLIFARTLIVKFHDLLETESLDSAWKVLMLAPIITALAVIWMKPVSAENVMTGRLRPICLVVLLAIPAVALFLYHIFWWLSKKMIETAQLHQSYDLLQMEEKQYQKTLRYLHETSNARHDFRQHIHVIEEYLQAAEYDKLKEYIAPISESVNRSHNVICKNQALDAIANHYDEAAKSQEVTIYWNIKVGETLPIKESDMCAVMGNLIENAVKAATSLTGDDRLVNVRVGILQEETLVIAIDNPYRGTLTLDKNGFPITDKPNHGIGLRSVRNIVDRYKGSMEIETHNGIFNVSILMYKPE